MLGGIHKLPQISYWSTSPSLDETVTYPYFTRTIPSDTAIAKPIIALCKQYKWNRLGVVYVNDAYGAGYASAVVTEGTTHGVSVASTGFEYRKPPTIQEPNPNFDNHADTIFGTPVSPITCRRSGP